MTHSTFFHFTKQPRYFAAIDEIREPHQSLDENGNHIWAGRKLPPPPHHTNEARKYSSATMNPEKGAPGLRVMGFSPLGKLPGSVWRLTYPQAVDRIIKGWAPTGICRACGEPRRPVVDKNQVRTQNDFAPKKRSKARELMEHPGGGLTPLGYPTTRVEATITGYACACTPYTDHPARQNTRPEARNWSEHPRGGQDVRFANHASKAQNTGPWREYHLEGWDPPPTDEPTILVSPPLPESP